MLGLSQSGETWPMSTQFVHAQAIPVGGNPAIPELSNPAGYWRERSRLVRRRKRHDCECLDERLCSFPSMKRPPDPETDAFQCLCRYLHGYYPYFDRKMGKFYWDRDPRRAILKVTPETLRRARRLQRTRSSFAVCLNRDFKAVIDLLSDDNTKPDTWVRDRVIDVYDTLHRSNLLVTIEAYQHEKLVGAILGVALPRVFAAETMVHTVDNASKACLHYLVEACYEAGVPTIDFQVPHPADHPCARLGEITITLEEYLRLISEDASRSGHISGDWTMQLRNQALDRHRATHFGTEADWQSTDAELVTDGQGTTLRINDLQVMQSWEAPLMRRMASVCREGDKVLEIGYGLGLAAAEIQARKPALHVIVEAHHAIAERARHEFAEGIKSGTVRIVRALWQQAAPMLFDGEGFDVIVFDDFPLAPGDMRRSAYSFFGVAAQMLNPGGRFTYFSDERLTLSALHQIALRQAFPRSRITTEPVSVEPPPDCDYWREPQLLHVEVELPHTAEAQEG